MNRSLAYSCSILFAVAILELTARPALTGGQSTALVRLQSTSPGSPQIGNINVGGVGLFSKVGVGNANPGTRLDVNGTIRATGFQLITGSAVGRVLTSDSSGVGTWQSLPATFWNTNGGDLWNANSGNVGIGTNNPGAKLEVSGTVRAEGLQMASGAAEGRVLITDDAGNGTWQDPNFAGRANQAFRWNVFSTYDQQTGWAMNNDPSLFGGVPPSSWTDGGATAEMINLDHHILQALFTRRGTFGPNALVYCDSFLQVSSTTSKVVVCLFRVRNTTTADIVWVPTFNYTCYEAWGEKASCAVNGILAWSTGASGQASPFLTIPADQTSTVIFVSTAGVPTTYGGPTLSRLCVLGFVNDSLVLPDGLQFIDDFDTML